MDDDEHSFEAQALGIGDRSDTVDIETPLLLVGPLTFKRARSPVGKPGA
jgi:hypothetical protein